MVLSKDFGAVLMIISCVTGKEINIDKKKKRENICKINIICPAEILNGHKIKYFII